MSSFRLSILPRYLPHNWIQSSGLHTARLIRPSSLISRSLARVSSRGSSSASVIPSPIEATAMKEMRSFWAKNEPRPFQHARPLSPHLTIFKWQMHMFLSVANRGCIIVSSFLWVLLGFWTLFVFITGFGGGGPDGKGPRAAWFENFLNLAREYKPNAVELFDVKAFVVLPALGACLGGFRHALWNASLLLEPKMIALSGWAIVAVFCAAVGLLAYDNILLAKQHGNPLFYDVFGWVSGKNIQPKPVWTGVAYEKVEHKEKKN